MTYSKPRPSRCLTIHRPDIGAFITVGNNTVPYLVEDNKHTKRFQLIAKLLDVKHHKVTPEAAGQINMYLNYYATEVNDVDDNPPIGIILCTEKDAITAEYALGGLSNQIFASRYVLQLPNKEELIAQVEAVMEKWEHNNIGTGN